MDLDSVFRFILPQSMQISDDIRGTAPASISRDEVITALSTIGKKYPFGTAIFTLKSSRSNGAMAIANKHANELVLSESPLYIRKTAGNKFRACALIIARFALATSLMSAETGNSCIICNGSGTMPHLDNPEKSGVCEGCKGKGSILRCRCGGTGKISRRIDKRRTQKGAGDTCTKCNGKGHASIKIANLRRAISTTGLIVKADTFARHWWPFYKDIVERIAQEEEKAKQAFREVTI